MLNKDVFKGTVDRYLTFNIQCWKADDSTGDFYNDLRSALADIAEYAKETSQEIGELADPGEDGGESWSRSSPAC